MMHFFVEIFTQPTPQDNNSLTNSPYDCNMINATHRATQLRKTYLMKVTHATNKQAQQSNKQCS